MLHVSTLAKQVTVALCIVVMGSTGREKNINTNPSSNSGAALSSAVNLLEKSVMGTHTRCTSLYSHSPRTHLESSDNQYQGMFILSEREGGENIRVRN